MTIYSNHPQVRLPIAEGMPPLTAPLVRPVDLFADVPGLTMRVYSAGDVVPGLTVVLAVTELGHWWRTDDRWNGAAGTLACAPCRGCGVPSLGADEHGRCPKPASQQDITSALLGRERRQQVHVVEPGDCPKAHRYHIYSGPADTTSAPFDTAERARVLYDATPERDEPIWYVLHADGTYCSRESQRQEVLGMRLDAERVAA